MNMLDDIEFKIATDIAATGQRYDRVLDQIDEQHKALQGHAGELESQASQLDQLLGTMLAGDNGGPNDGETVSSDSESGQVINGVKAQ